MWHETFIGRLLKTLRREFTWRNGREANKGRVLGVWVDAFAFTDLAVDMCTEICLQRF